MTKPKPTKVVHWEHKCPQCGFTTSGFALNPNLGGGAHCPECHVSMSDDVKCVDCKCAERFEVIDRLRHD